MTKNLLSPKPAETQSVISDAALVQEKPLDGSLHSACSPFVFLDLNSEPWLVHNGWLHRWHRGAKCWVTARPFVSGETEIMAERKLKPEHAALYGPPCSENT